jgi:hypothetical protein
MVAVLVSTCAYYGLLDVCESGTAVNRGCLGRLPWG